MEDKLVISCQLKTSLAKGLPVSVNDISAERY
jgi:hypothetical protein